MSHTNIITSQPLDINHFVFVNSFQIKCNIKGGRVVIIFRRQARKIAIQSGYFNQNTFLLNKALLKFNFMSTKKRCKYWITLCSWSKKNAVILRNVLYARFYRFQIIFHCCWYTMALSNVVNTPYCLNQLAYIIILCKFIYTCAMQILNIFLFYC